MEIDWIGTVIIYIATICNFILQVAEYESTTFAIFYNNALFLSVLIFASFYVFPSSVSPTINYVASMGISAGLIALLSTGTAPA